MKREFKISLDLGAHYWNHEAVAICPISIEVEYPWAYSIR